MSEMIERVARALCLANGEDPDKPSGAFGVWWKSYEAEARAAIEAMREPTEGMFAAVDCGGEKKEWLSGKVHRVSWQTMIDAALSEKP